MWWGEGAYEHAWNLLTGGLLEKTEKGAINRGGGGGGGGGGGINLRAFTVFRYHIMKLRALTVSQNWLAVPVVLYVKWVFPRDVPTNIP